MNTTQFETDFVREYQTSLRNYEREVHEIVEKSYSIVARIEAEFRALDHFRFSEEFEEMTEDSQRELIRIYDRLNQQIKAVKMAGQGRR